MLNNLRLPISKDLIIEKKKQGLSLLSAPPVLRIVALIYVVLFHNNYDLKKNIQHILLLESALQGHFSRKQE